MNNIQEKDWAEDDWGWHSGMASNPYEDDGPPPEGQGTDGRGWQFGGVGGGLGVGKDGCLSTSSR